MFPFFFCIWLGLILVFGCRFLLCVGLLWDNVKSEGLLGIGSLGLDLCGVLGGGVLFCYVIILSLE